MEYNYEKEIMKFESVDVNYVEKQKPGCKSCKQKQKKGCKMCKESRNKFNWLLFWSIYIMIFAVWGHIELIKLFKKFF
jgi:hypothetical protein